MATTRFADHLLTGPHASRPAATAVPAGTLYACSDHSLVYQSDGSSWSTWATLTGTGMSDVLPVAPFARILCVFEMVTGVLFIAVLIARLAGQYPPERP